MLNSIVENQILILHNIRFLLNLFTVINFQIRPGITYYIIPKETHENKICISVYKNLESNKLKYDKNKNLIKTIQMRNILHIASKYFKDN